MQNRDISLLDDEFDLQVPMPSTVEELDALIGPGGTVEYAVDNLLYRNWYPRIYAAASKHVAEKLSFPKAGAVDKNGAPVPARKLKDGTEKTVHETDIDHLRRYSKTSDENKEFLKVVFTEIGPTQPLYAKGDRSGTGKIAQAATDSANGIIANGTAAVEKAAETIESKVPGYKVARDGDGEVTPEGLARAIVALQKKLVADATKAAKSDLGL